MIAALLGWTKLPQWALELGVIAALAIAFGLYHHHVLEQGIRAQQTADRRASAKVEAKAAAATEAAQAAANAAEESYREEIARNLAARPLGSVLLCDNAHRGSRSMSEGSSAYPGNARTGSSPGSISGVPSGDSGLRTQRAHDISGLLGAWAQAADGVSATLREFQGRQ